MKKSISDTVYYALAGFAATLIAIAALALCTGCVYKGAKMTEGTDLSLGMNVPGSDGTLQFDVMNYLTGFRIGVAENAALKVKYNVAETNDYFWGMITIRSNKDVDAKVEPCEVSTQQKE